MLQRLHGKIHQDAGSAEKDTTPVFGDTAPAQGLSGIWLGQPDTVSAVSDCLMNSDNTTSQVLQEITLKQSIAMVLDSEHWTSNQVMPPATSKPSGDHLASATGPALIDSGSSHIRTRKCARKHGVGKADQMPCRAWVSHASDFNVFNECSLTSLQLIVLEFYGAPPQRIRNRSALSEAGTPAVFNKRQQAVTGTGVLYQDNGLLQNCLELVLQPTYPKSFPVTQRLFPIFRQPPRGQADRAVMIAVPHTCGTGPPLKKAPLKHTHSCEPHNSKPARVTL
ncbi:hypothetical protein STEG23_003049 [Scotinomys teguina]